MCQALKREAHEGRGLHRGKGNQGRYHKQELRNFYIIYILDSTVSQKMNHFEKTFACSEFFLKQVSLPSFLSFWERPHPAN
jgi:hypothetical protein